MAIPLKMKLSKQDKTPQQVEWKILCCENT